MMSVISALEGYAEVDIGGCVNLLECMDDDRYLNLKTYLTAAIAKHFYMTSD